MPHTHHRFLFDIVKQVMNFSPLVGILGHRQVGKTTLTQTVAKKYLTLDDEETLFEVRKSPKGFLKNHAELKTAIDECQIVPALFPALKERVRVKKIPGQYILTGSVRFTSRKAIRESLTGRIINLELLPLSISEIQHRALSDLAPQLIAAHSLNGFLQSFESEIHSSLKLSPEIPLYLERGGLPGVCFVRSQQLRATRIADQIRTILDRDIKMVYPTTLVFSQLLALFQFLANNQGQAINHSERFKFLKRPRRNCFTP